MANGPWSEYGIGDDEFYIEGDGDELLGIDAETAEMLGLSWGDVASAGRKLLPILAPGVPQAAGMIRRAFGGGGGGRAPTIVRRNRAIGGAPNAAQRGYADRLASGRYGAPAAGAKEWPLGFPLITFTDTSPTAQNSVTRPQRLFRGRRLFIAVTRSAGAAGVAVTLNRLDVGADNQLVAAGALPVETFASNAFDSRLVLSPAAPGIDITLGFSVTPAPGVGESVVVAASIHGDSWGS